jgi:hypothetical protein
MGKKQGLEKGRNRGRKSKEHSDEKKVRSEQERERNRTGTRQRERNKQEERKGDGCVLIRWLVVTLYAEKTRKIIMLFILCRPLPRPPSLPDG